MKIEYNHTFRLPLKIVWKYMKDVTVLKNAIPGCRSFSERTKGIYQAEIDINLGPIKDVFILEVRVEKENPPSLYQLEVKGNGNLGEVSGRADLYLKEIQGTTKVNIKADVQVSGALTAAANRVLNGGASKGIENFFQRVEKEIKRCLYQLRRGK